MPATPGVQVGVGATGCASAAFDGAAVRWAVQAGGTAQNSLDKYPEVEQLGHMIALFLIF